MAQTPATTHSRLKSCLMIGLIPVVLMLVLAGVFVANNRPPNIAVPTPKMPKDNGWGYFVRAAETMDRIGHRGPVSDPVRKPNDWTTAEMKSFVDDNAPVLELIREGLTKQYRHPPIRDFTHTPFEHYAHFRELARTMLSTAMYYERIGNWSGAVQVRLGCIELGAILPTGGVVVTASVGAAIEYIGEHDIGRLLARLDEDDLAASARRLEKIRRRRADPRGLFLEEGMVSAAVFQDDLRGSGLRDMLEVPASYDLGWDKRTRLDRGLTTLNFAFGNKKRMLLADQRYMAELAKEARRPYDGESRVPVPPNPVSQALHQLLSRISRASLYVGRTKAALLELEVALRRYRLANDRYPAKLSDLTPKYLSKIPVDPFGGKALRYRVLDNGRDFLLYSIGPDLVDDKGKPGQRNPLNPSGDLVAGEY